MARIEHDHVGLIAPSGKGARTIHREGGNSVVTVCLGRGIKKRFLDSSGHILVAAIVQAGHINDHIRSRILRCRAFCAVFAGILHHDCIGLGISFRIHTERRLNVQVSEHSLRLDTTAGIAHGYKFICTSLLGRVIHTEQRRTIGQLLRVILSGLTGILIADGKCRRVDSRILIADTDQNLLGIWRIDCRAVDDYITNRF